MKSNKGAILIISKRHKNMCISISYYLDNFIYFSVITDSNILETGLYGYTGKCKIYVSKIVGKGYFRTSDLDNPSIKNEDDWSDEISFDNYTKDNEKLMVII